MEPASANQPRMNAKTKETDRTGLGYVDLTQSRPQRLVLLRGETGWRGPFFGVLMKSPEGLPYVRLTKRAVRRMHETDMRLWVDLRDGFRAELEARQPGDDGPRQKDGTRNNAAQPLLHNTVHKRYTTKDGQKHVLHYTLDWVRHSIRLSYQIDQAGEGGSHRVDNRLGKSSQTWAHNRLQISSADNVPVLAAEDWPVRFIYPMWRMKALFANAWQKPGPVSWEVELSFNQYGERLGGTAWNAKAPDMVPRPHPGGEQKEKEVLEGLFGSAVEGLRLDVSQTLRALMKAVGQESTGRMQDLIRLAKP